MRKKKHTREYRVAYELAIYVQADSEYDARIQATERMRPVFTGERGLASLICDGDFQMLEITEK